MCYKLPIVYYYVFCLLFSSLSLSCSLNALLSNCSSDISYLRNHHSEEMFLKQWNAKKNLQLELYKRSQQRMKQEGKSGKINKNQGELINYNYWFIVHCLSLVFSSPLIIVFFFVFSLIPSVSHLSATLREQRAELDHLQAEVINSNCIVCMLSNVDLSMTIVAINLLYLLLEYAIT